MSETHHSTSKSDGTGNRAPQPSTKHPEYNSKGARDGTVTEHHSRSISTKATHQQTKPCKTPAPTTIPLRDASALLRVPKRVCDAPIEQNTNPHAKWFEKNVLRLHFAPPETSQFTSVGYGAQNKYRVHITAQKQLSTVPLSPTINIDNSSAKLKYIHAAATSQPKVS